MTVEAKVPLNDVKLALHHYSCLYNIVSNSKLVYSYKTRVARKTISSLLASIVKIILLIIFITVTCSTAGGAQMIFGVLSVLMGVFVLLDLFYLQSLPDKRFRKIRFRYSYYIKCIAQDISEFSWFRRYFGVKAHALPLIYGIGSGEAYSRIEDWGYMIGEDHLKAVTQYKQKYSSYRDYVDLGSMWYMCGDLLKILNSGRAVDIQSAMAVVDRREHQKRIEQIASNAADRIASAHEAAARAVSDAAHSVKDAARSEENFWNEARNRLSRY